MKADLSPVELEMMSAQPTPMRNPEPQTPREDAPRFLTHGNLDIRNICHFQPLSYGAICYAAINN